jgi:hypothetical protein
MLQMPTIGDKRRTDHTCSASPLGKIVFRMRQPEKPGEFTGDLFRPVFASVWPRLFELIFKGWSDNRINFK